MFVFKRQYGNIFYFATSDPTKAEKASIVQNIADAVTHARFVGGDNNSDGVVLLKIVQVLRTLMLSPEGSSLSNESVCEIILSCFRICFETRLNGELIETSLLLTYFNCVVFFFQNYFDGQQSKR